MRRVIVLVLGLTILLGSALQVVASEEQMLQGIVSDSAGRPLAKARVELSEFGIGLIATYRTDSQGRFSVDRRAGPAALWQLQVSLDGYRSEESGWYSPAARLTHSFRLTPLYGRMQIAVQGPDGESINGHLILLGPGGAIVANEGFSQGRFTQQQVAPVSYQVIVLASGYAPTAHNLTVEAGRTASALIRVKGDKAVVSGSVIDAILGLPLPGATVEVIRQGGGLAAQTVSLAQGRFEVEVQLAEPDRYHLRVEAPGYRSISTPEVELRPGQRYDYSGAGSPALLPFSGRIDGVTLQRSGGPAKEATVTLQLQGYGVVAEVTTDKRGEFRFDHVLAGPGLVYRIRADWSGDSVSTDWIELAAGSIAQITLRPQPSVTDSVGSGTLSGLVLSAAGSPVAGAKVEIIRRNQPARKVETDSFGGFIITELAASATDWFALEPYTAKITKEGYAASYEFMLDGQSATEFPLVDHLRTVIRVTLHSNAGTVHGRLLDTDGRPVVSQLVELHTDGQQGHQTEQTDTDGWYEFVVPLERPGLGHSLRVVASGYKKYAPLELGDRVRKGLPLQTIWIEPSASIFAGQVVDMDGWPAEGLLVQALGPDGTVRATTRTNQLGLFRLDFALRPFEVKSILVVTAESGQNWAMLTPPGQEIRWTIPDWDLHRDQ